MKVVQVNCVYGKGSTGKIVQDIHRELQKRGVESIVCYGRGAKVKEKNVYKVCGELYAKANNLWSRITGIMYGGCFFSTQRLIHIIKKERPDIVHLQCINGYFVNIYRLIEWLKRNKINTVLTLHAEFMYTANCGYALDCEKWREGCGACPRCRQETKSWFFDGTARSFKRMKAAFDGFGENLEVVSVSPWLKDRAAQSKILEDKKHVVVLNGIDTDVFCPCESSDLREKYVPQGGKIVFHATPYFTDDPDHLKGGYYVLKLAELMPNVQFVVAGDYRHGLQLPSNVTLLGQITDQKELATYYSMADVTVLASKKETFSLVTAESLCCGTPVVGFRAGAPEQIAIREYAEFVQWGDLAAMEAALKRVLNKNYDKKMIASEAAAKYSKTTMGNEYIATYRKLGENR